MMATCLHHVVGLWNAAAQMVKSLIVHKVSGAAVWAQKFRCGTRHLTSEKFHHPLDRAIQVI